MFVGCKTWFSHSNLAKSAGLTEFWVKYMHLERCNGRKEKTCVLRSFITRTLQQRDPTSLGGRATFSILPMWLQARQRWLCVWHDNVHYTCEIKCRLNQQITTFEPQFLEIRTSAYQFSNYSSYMVLFKSVVPNPFWLTDQKNNGVYQSIGILYHIVQHKQQY